MTPARDIESLAQRIEFEPDVAADRRILSAAETALDRQMKPPRLTETRLAGRQIMKTPFAKLALAAGVIIAVLLGIHFVRDTSSAAWANVLAKVNGFETYVFRTREIKTTGPRPDGFEFATEGGSKRYYSQTYGAFTENYKNEGELFTRIYTLLQKNEFVAICYPLESYNRRPLTEAQIREFHENPLKDPKQIITRMLEGDYEELGDDVIDGRAVQGIELRDPSVLSDGPAPPMADFAMRVWIDVETELPVWVEIDAVPEGSPIRRTTIIDEFEWGAPLAAGLFEPEIPAGFEPETPMEYYTDSAPKSDAEAAFAANTQEEPYLSDFDHLDLPDVSGVTLLGVDPAAEQAELRLGTHDEIWQTQDAFMAEWPRYDDVEDQLAAQLQAQLGVEQMTVEELVALGIAMRERFWELRGCTSDNAYPYGYAARLVTKMAHEKAPDDPAVTDQYVESIMTAEVTSTGSEDDQTLVRNPVYPGLVADLRARQFELIKARVSAGDVPAWKDYVRTFDLIIVLNSNRKDYEGALAATRWLIAQAETAGWTYYVDRWLVPMEKAFAGGEGYRSGLFMYEQGAFPEEFRYARRLFSFQGPARRRTMILPIHLRHLKGW
ncbi:MAG: hypothetical protein JSW27_12170 [Phycisphaerales bacterium]|nr:MAG: hypothetical protein JSW27_12170 [Phycisphaerales bacterium]